MNRDNGSIGGQIKRLARETGAPTSFVTRVQGLFSRKGISLESDGTPYVDALKSAFVRERMIRERADQTRERIEQLQGQLIEVSSTFQNHLERLRRIQEALNRKFPPDAPVRRQVASGEPRAPRTRRVKVEIERGFLVPGPKDPQ